MRDDLAAETFNNIENLASITSEDHMKDFENKPEKRELSVKEKVRNYYLNVFKALDWFIYFWFLSFYLTSIYISEISYFYKLIMTLVIVAMLLLVYLYGKLNAFNGE